VEWSLDLRLPGEAPCSPGVDGGHIPSDRNEIIRETLDWLDRYLGAVTVEVERRQPDGPPLLKSGRAIEPESLPSFAQSGEDITIDHP